VSVLAVGVSHRNAPVSVLERAAIAPDDVGKILHELVRGEHVGEALVVSTCNRVEAYVDTDKFHGGTDEVSAVLARHAGMPVSDLAEHLYVHYEQAAVHHLFRMTSGLDSMVVGESQILGQVRSAYTLAAAEQTVGRELHELAQRALSAAKRVHSETEIDRAGASMVNIAVEQARAVLGGLSGRSALIVGAGSMGALAAATLVRAGLGGLVIANRTSENASRLADGLPARAVGIEEVEAELAAADLLVCATGSTSVLVNAATVAAAMRGRADRPLVILDIAMPRDVDPGSGDVPGVTYVDIEALQGPAARAGAGSQSVAAAERIVDEEVEGYLSWQRSIEVAPTIAALRARAADLVEAELSRFDARWPGLEPRLRAEVAQTVRRTVSTLLHGPTVRVKQLADAPGGDVYADALRTLFGLVPGATDAVMTPLAPLDVPIDAAVDVAVDAAVDASVDAAVDVPADLPVAVDRADAPSDGDAG